MFRKFVATLLLVSNVAIGQETQPAEPAPTSEPAADPSSLTVQDVAVCTAIENRTPVGAADSFTADVGSLYCFGRVSGADSPAQIYHRWYVGDTMVREIPIQVKSSPWRCWSVKSIQAAWTGTCRVDIVNESGDVLGSKTFTLGAEGAAPQG